MKVIIRAAAIDRYRDCGGWRDGTGEGWRNGTGDGWRNGRRDGDGPRP